MFGSQVLDVAIGIIFIFILVSIICSAVREGIEALLSSRAAYLEHGIRELLHDKKAEGLAKSFFNHPLIYSLFTSDYKPGKDSKRPPFLANGSDLPAYIPSKNFALALMDIAARGQTTDAVSSDPNGPVISLNNIRMNILNLNNKAVQRALLVALDSAQGDINKAQKNIEAWYDSSMDRVSGWYKRSTNWILFWLGLIIAIGLNVNTISIADYLYRNEGARSALVARAEAAAKDTTFTSRNYQAAKQDLEALGLPIGWGRSASPEQNNNAWNNFWAPVLGWLLTALAATIGAPFWFDLLNKVMVIRSTVKPHEKSPEEDSEDRQLPKKQQEVLVKEVPPIEANAPIVFTDQQIIFNKQPGPRDDETHVDGCEVEIIDITEDQNLPPAEGGVA